MADQTQRLEIATVRAEVGSNIVYRFANDAENEGGIPTDSGSIQNLKQVIIEIQEDAADKISIATTIYQTPAAGLAATADGGIFLVQSSDTDTIYTVWKNQAGAAVNTGKTAMSSQAVQDALTASNEAAQAAEDAADVATNRTAGFLQPSAEAPVVRDDGLPLQIGDRYFNTEQQAEYLYKAGGWQANDSLGAIDELKDPDDLSKGASLIPYDGTNLGEQLLLSRKFPSYAALRAYSGSATVLELTGPRIAGRFFSRPRSVNDKDDFGITILSNDGQRTLVRDYQGMVQLYWFDPAGAGGAVEDSLAAERCAKATPGGQLATNDQLATGVPYPYFASAYVGPGNYNFQTLVDTGGKVFSWVMDHAARITGTPEALNAGRVEWIGIRTSMPMQPGIRDAANVVSWRAHNTPNDGAGISGITSPANLSQQVGYDSCTVYADNVAPPLLINVPAATYAENSITPSVALTAYQVKLLRPGMIINTFHAPTKYAAFIVGWEADGSKIYTTSWYLASGTLGPAATPPNGPGAGFNPKTKIWTVNTNTQVKANSHATRAAGYELGMLNDKAPLNDANWPQMWGMDVVSLGAYTIERAFTSRGPHDVGMHAEGSTNGVYADNCTLGYRYRGAGTPCQFTTSALDPIFSVSQSGSMLMSSMGNTDATSVFHEARRRRASNTATVALDRVYTNRAYGYDGASEYLGAQVIVIQRSAFSSNLARFSYDIQAKANDGTSVGVTVNGSGDKSFAPLADNTISFGTSSSRITQLFAVTTTISTSDEKLKTPFRSFSDIETEAIIACGAHIDIYQWLSDVEEKGAERARLHAGVPAQRCVAEFESRGLDPWRYAWFCRDKKIVKVKEVIKDKRQVVDFVDQEEKSIEFIDGVPTLVVRAVKAEIPRTESVAVRDQNGEIIMLSSREFIGRDEDTGRSLYQEVKVPMMVDVPVMEDYERETETEQESDEYIYGLRENQLLMAWMKVVLQRTAGQSHS
ncbi:hypothetical protein SAMN03159444_00078 [Pseudomonas sp. NFACC02]|uniref:tail fiber domain-containing protein n=1 Tax=Pseudomonas sp. NFACC02 TaxID=1566250 RepID=UPI0008D62FC6|nr:hypothetical protein [Pseudomonas sp. NFACC02]SEP57017.1 hypothetical protein SAMN03159444_00078 [Pseudomonas sp. NFACC02]